MAVPRAPRNLLANWVRETVMQNKEPCIVHCANIGGEVNATWLEVET